MNERLLWHLCITDRNCQELGPRGSEQVTSSVQASVPSLRNRDEDAYIRHENSVKRCICKAL